MFRRIGERQKINILQKSIDRLADMLEKSNIHDFVYVLGSKKEILRRNLLAGIARGIGSRYRFYYNNCNYYIFFTKNSKIKYSNNW